MRMEKTAQHKVIMSFGEATYLLGCHNVISSAWFAVRLLTFWWRFSDVLRHMKTPNLGDSFSLIKITSHSRQLTFQSEGCFLAMKKILGTFNQRCNNKQLNRNTTTRDTFILLLFYSAITCCVLSIPSWLIDCNLEPSWHLRLDARLPVHSSEQKLKWRSLVWLLPSFFRQVRSLWTVSSSPHQTITTARTIRLERQFMSKRKKMNPWPWRIYENNCNSERISR